MISGPLNSTRMGHFPQSDPRQKLQEYQDFLSKLESEFWLKHDRRPTDEERKWLFVMADLEPESFWDAETVTLVRGEDNELRTPEGIPISELKQKPHKHSFYNPNMYDHYASFLENEVGAIIERVGWSKHVVTVKKRFVTPNV